MAPHLYKNGEFHVVFTGRVDKPTIYSSWSQAHPRVVRSTGDDKKKFTSLEAAQNAIRSRGFTDWVEDIKPNAKKRTTPFSQGPYYAVAGCKTTGIFDSWKRAEKATTGTTACFRRFETEGEAEEFIREWKDAYADVWRRAIRQGLDNGWKPKDMEFDISLLLVRQNGGNILEIFEQLGIREELRE